MCNESFTHGQFGQLQRELIGSGEGIFSLQLLELNLQRANSEAYNFEKQRFTDAFVHQAIADAARDGRPADLSGATVYVAGASAQSASRAHDVQKFWLAYTKAANGKLSLENYSLALMNFGQ